MSSHPIDVALNRYKKHASKKPDGTYSAEECQARWKMSPEATRKTLSDMKTAKLVAEVAGRKVNAAGQVVACVYYRFPQP
jgi:DNA-binding IscR family transcriptional regulator